LITDHSQRLTTGRWEQAVDRAQERVNRLSLEDKLAVALHDFAAVTAENFVPFDYCDGPNGVRGHEGATAFPSTLALAASFDRELARRYGAALGQEALTAGKNAILAPALDIARVPHGGRAGENLGEDPMLAGEIGGAVGAGIQAEGVLAVAKHYVANDFEWLRTGNGSLPRRSDAIDIRVSSRTLHEIYLEPFRRALVRYGVAGLLGSYNRLNGRYTCQDPELLDIPRTQWGWAGFIVPDFLFAVRDPRAALEAGLDLPALGSDSQLTREDLLANEARLDSIALHVLAAVEYVGLKLMHEPSPQPPPGSASVAKIVAIEGMVLLKNDGPLLPMPASTRVAVVDAVNVTVIHAWFPGEQFAPALADVLTGRAEPGGRLPITVPTDESSTPIQESHQYPGVNGVATYSEELLVGYRWYQQRGVEPAFPFGHGLGYTSFEFDDSRAVAAEALISVTFSVRNVGSRRGKAVPQLYVPFPPRPASRQPS
jgi:beta-glucosidase-like glycosyl hydrolase